MWGDDPACRQAGVGPARNTIQITDVPPAGQADHCAICHWLRTARGARTVLSASTTVSLHSTDPLVLRRASRAPLDVVSYRPSRAPPTRII